MDESPIPIPLDELFATGAVLRDGHSKFNRILGSSLAIVSLISSSALVWMIKRSRAGFKTTYNRILLAMAVSDILYSLGLAHFNFLSPSDGSYYVWNASGNQITCNIQGFTLWVGSSSGLLYSCSLNLYSLVVVKYNKPDSYIRRKVEPFLHGFPIANALISGIIFLAKDNINDGGGGHCNSAVYRPPHCIGYEDGETREGFDIPCGRGHDGPVLLRYLGSVTVLILVPLTVGTSLGMIYRTVSKQENSMASYGASNFMASAPQADRSNSRIVMHKALAYSISYFLTWSFVIIGNFFDVLDMEWPIAVWYLSTIFNPLQGVSRLVWFSDHVFQFLITTSLTLFRNIDQFFNFGIYIYPKVTREKSRGGFNMTWFQAFKIAFWGGGSGHSANRIRRVTPDRTPQAPVVGQGTLPTRDDTTTDQLGQDDAEKLDNESKNEENNNATTADGVDDGYQNFLTILNTPSASPASDAGLP